jgi:RNA polymerase sigma factor (sigma-70 family)
MTSSSGRNTFPTTHWSVVLEASSLDAPAARAALEILCRRYWYPLYAFARRQGRDHHKAEDLTQAFFAYLVETGMVERARPERGRFRTLLLAAAKHFLTDEWRRAHAQKRAGGCEHVAICLSGANERFDGEPRDSGLTPDEAFDRSWALSVIEHASSQLRDEYVANGRGALYAQLAGCVWAAQSPQTHSEMARQLNMTEHAFTMALSRLRERLRKRLQAEVAATVANEGEIGDELNRLFCAVRRKTK